METLFKSLLALHIAGGTSALITGAVAMLTRKGGRQHRMAGSVYFWSMAMVCASAVGMCILHPQQFLFYVAIFSFYLCFTGKRITARKQVGATAARLDWAAAAIALVGGAIMLVQGIVAVLAGKSFGAVGATFGCLCIGFAVRDMRSFVAMMHGGAQEKMHWFFTHLTRMVGAYIATFTAFMVVNVKFLPPLVVWLGPTVIGTIGISFWVAHYTKKFRLQPPALIVKLQRLLGATSATNTTPLLLMAAGISLTTLVTLVMLVMLVTWSQPLSAKSLSATFLWTQSQPPTSSKQADTCSVRLVVKNLRNSNGKLMVRLQNADGKSVQEVALVIRNNAVEYVFEGLLAGKYALRMFHDENSNGQMERNFLGLPTEGYGFSNNAKIMFGPPTLDKLLFLCTTQTTQNVGIVY
jgi:uncharacterized protein (DUF2141 family)/uncharacterized membrane protein